MVSEPFNSAVCFHVPSVSVNTYARPACLAAPGAPTTAFLPDIATVSPKYAPRTVSEPSSSSVCCQSPFLSVKTYARPCFACREAPTIAIVPEMATGTPKPSPGTVSEPFSSVSCFPIGVFPGPVVAIDEFEEVMNRLNRLTCGSGTKNTAKMTAATATTITRWGQTPGWRGRPAWLVAPR